MTLLLRLTLAGLALLLLAPFSAQAQTPTPAAVRVTPASVQVTAGQTVDVAVEVIAVQDLYGCDVALSFDPAVVEVVDVDPTLDGIQVGHGLFLDPGFVLYNLADNQAGALRMAITQMNPSLPKSGTGTLIVVTFRGKQVGASTPLTLTRSQLARRDGVEIPSIPASGQLEVVPEAPPGPTNTPIPTQGAGTPVPTRTPMPTAVPTTAVPTATRLPATDLPTDTPVPTNTPPPPLPSATSAQSPSPQATQAVQPATATSEPAAVTAPASTPTPSATAVGPTATPAAAQPAATTVVQVQPDTPSGSPAEPGSSSRDSARALLLFGAVVFGLAVLAGLAALAYLGFRRRR